MQRWQSQIQECNVANKTQEDAESILNNHELANCFIKLGVVTFELQQLDKSLEYYNTALDLQEKLGINQNFSFVYQALSQVYLWKEEYNLPLQYSRKSLAVLPVDHRSRSTSFEVIDDVYRDKKHLIRALHYRQKSIDTRVCLLEDNHSQIGIAYNNKELIYEEKQKLSRSNEIL
ncbi:unnamed protein product [Rotaria sp. Silwood2]|nr:unnamed protein product [Rotaria sp. Silwood2]CAF3351887.1 unnamed protein product [Rotaria sp. Silwood2]CAF4016827.1 unnamed protein product [Rotaria sp. Silwood2]CAF4169596.1 unnamed protein product [Rotaria sp. Silwood2]CAF4368543.1 unnamed protein product [Rotaria sp. Silwood2]